MGREGASWAGSSDGTHGASHGPEMDHMGGRSYGPLSQSKAPSLGRPQEAWGWRWCHGREDATVTCQYPVWAHPMKAPRKVSRKKNKKISLVHMPHAGQPGQYSLCLSPHSFSAWAQPRRNNKWGLVGAGEEEEMSQEGNTEKPPALPAASLQTWSRSSWEGGGACLCVNSGVNLPMEDWPGHSKGLPGGSDKRNLPAMQKTWVRSLGQEDSLE